MEESNWRDTCAEIKELGSDLGDGLREIGGKVGEVGGKVKELGRKVDEVGRKIEEVTGRIERRIDRLEGNYDVRIRQVEGRQRLKEQRFDRMLEGAGTTYATKEELEELKERIQRLEEAS